MTRTALVTGAASGMGLAISRDLAGRGHRVALVDRNGEGVRLAAEELRASGAAACSATVDVADRDSVDDAVAAARRELGPIEIVVTAAGIAAHRRFADIARDQWDEMLAVNLTGTFHCIQSAMPDMMAGGWGRIVTVSSLAGQTGAPMVDYAASKGGVIALTRALSTELARHGITANSIAPGTIETPMLQMTRDSGHFLDPERLAAMIPAGRVGTAEEIAATCAFLCSEEASYVSGQIIGVNGGMH
jgi:2-hydroxycyclohexanecarboxyl-CoA dehydrogenase